MDKKITKTSRTKQTIMVRKNRKCKDTNSDNTHNIFSELSLAITITG